jgi:hypothetical protein
LTHNVFSNGTTTGPSSFAGTAEGGNAFQDEENEKVE